MAVLAQDQFTGLTTNTSINGRSLPTGGGTWITADGPWGDGAGFAMVGGSRPGNEARFRSSNNYGPNVLVSFLEATGATFYTYSPCVLAVGCRLQSNYDGYYAYFYSFGDTDPQKGCKIVKRVSGVDTTIFEDINILAVSNSKISVKAVGTNISILFNDSIIGSVADTTFASGSIGGYCLAGGSDGDEQMPCIFSEILAETPVYSLISPAPAPIVLEGITGVVSAGYLSAADVAQITNALWAKEIATGEAASAILIDARKNAKAAFSVSV